MLRIDRTVVFGRDLLHDGDAVANLVDGGERRKPPVTETSNATQLGRRETTQPHVHRLLHRFRQHAHALQVEELTVMIDDVLGPEPAHEGHRFVEDARTLGALDPEGLLFEWIGDAEANSRKQPTTRQTVERRQFFGEHHRIAARDHEHAGAELQSAWCAPPRTPRR